MIEENVKDLAKAKFTAESANIVDKVMDDATIQGKIDAIVAKLITIADASHFGYDDATKNGTVGGVNQQGQATNAYNAAVAANP